MTLGELKGMVTRLSDDMNDWEVVNGEVGFLDPNDDDSMVYRVDKPIIAVYVDVYAKEICFFHQTQEDVANALNPQNPETDGDKN